MVRTLFCIIEQIYIFRLKTFEHNPQLSVRKCSNDNSILGWKPSHSRRVVFGTGHHFLPKNPFVTGLLDNQGDGWIPYQKTFWEGIWVFLDRFFRPKSQILW